MSEPSDEELNQSLIGAARRMQQSRWALERWLGNLLYKQAMRRQALMDRVKAEMEKREKRRKQ